MLIQVIFKVAMLTMLVLKRKGKGEKEKMLFKNFNKVLLFLKIWRTMSTVTNLSFGLIL